MSRSFHQKEGEKAWGPIVFWFAVRRQQWQLGYNETWTKRLGRVAAAAAAVACRPSPDVAVAVLAQWCRPTFDEVVWEKLHAQRSRERHHLCLSSWPQTVNRSVSRQSHKKDIVHIKWNESCCISELTDKRLACFQLYQDRSCMRDAEPSPPSPDDETIETKGLSKV